MTGQHSKSGPSSFIRWCVALACTHVLGCQMGHEPGFSSHCGQIKRPFRDLLVALVTGRKKGSPATTDRGRAKKKKKKTQHSQPAWRSCHDNLKNTRCDCQPRAWGQSACLPCAAQSWQARPVARFSDELFMWDLGRFILNGLIGGSRAGGRPPLTM
jgi:hypothetical protein